MQVETGLSITIPVLNEGSGLYQLLSELQQQVAGSPSIEIIVSDGGSDDDTIAIARSFDCLLVSGPPGRAKQLNNGAHAASQDRLLFLHADTRLPVGFHPAVLSAAEWGFFKLRLSGSSSVFRLLEFMISWRSKLRGISTGDQAQFFKRDFFDAIDGYPDIPLMEDVAISKQARARSRPTVIATPVTTSSRRWEQHGVVKTILLMWWLRFAFWIGISAQRLHRQYYPQHD